MKKEEVELHMFLTLALDRGEWSASCYRHFPSLEKDLWYPLGRRQGDPQSWSRHRDRKKIFPY
jgi:hypothetical protein